MQLYWNGREQSAHTIIQRRQALSNGADLGSTIGLSFGGLRLLEPMMLALGSSGNQCLKNTVEASQALTMVAAALGTKVRVEPVAELRLGPC